jgi:two-component system phosphate regulon response regulator PhoB
MPMILVVDDEPDQLTVLALLLEIEQFEVVTARDGFQALHLARNQPVALVLTDLMMPGMDGLDLCHALREDPATRHLPIILNSAGAAQPPGEGTLYDVFMSKPAIFQEQLAQIRRLLKTG